MLFVLPGIYIIQQQLTGATVLESGVRPWLWANDSAFISFESMTTSYYS
jgi:hypothetical protein